MDQKMQVLLPNGSPEKPESTLSEIRFIGRGGQGVVSAAQLVAEAAMAEGKYIQAFPEFGAERSGAPISAYARISNEPIEIHCLIREPAITVVIDRSLSQAKSSTIGLKQDGLMLCNYDGSGSELLEKLELRGRAKLFTVKAREIAMSTIGRDIANTPMMGALIKVSKLVELESVESVIAKRFKDKILQSNIIALKQGYEGVLEAL